MKKFVKCLALVLVIIFSLSFIGCGKYSDDYAKKILKENYTYYEVLDDLGTPVIERGAFGSSGYSGTLIYAKGCKNVSDYQEKLAKGKTIKVLTITFDNNHVNNVTFDEVENKVSAGQNSNVSDSTGLFGLGVFLTVVIIVFVIAIEIIVCYTAYVTAVSKRRNGIFWAVWTFFGGIIILLCIAIIPEGDGWEKVKEEEVLTERPKWRCPKCGEIKTGEYCIKCGTTRPSNTAPTPKTQNSWKCKKCGELNNPLAKACIECGSPRE